MKVRTPVPVIVMLLVASAAPHGRADAPPKFDGGVLPTPTGRPNAEPGVTVDGGGTIWVSSLMAGHVPSGPDDTTPTDIPGTGVWRSRDGGRTFEWVIDPYKPIDDLPGVPLAGNDSDIAAAPERNTRGLYNVYAAALYPSNASIAWSYDGGATWIRQPISGITGFPFDRPWVAADGPCGLYLAYHSGPPWFVHRYDFCDPTEQAIAKEPVWTVEIGPEGIEGRGVLAGKIHVDTSRASRFSGNVYLPMETCAGPLGSGEGEEEIVEGVEPPIELGSGCRDTPSVMVASSADRGRTWTAKRVAAVHNGAAPIWPVTVATDADGTVYVSWFDNHDAYLSRSDDGAKTWSRPVLVNTGMARTAAYPTVAATTGATVAVAYYGTTRDGDANDARVMGAPGSSKGAEWRVWYALSKNAGKSFTQHPASPVVHLGMVCTRGGACDVPNSRNLFDDFGMVFHPRTQAPTIAYTTDRVAVPGRTIGTLDTTFTAFATQLP